SGPIAEVPPADRFEVRLGIRERINRLNPVGLHRFIPRPVPTGRRDVRPHALLVEAIDGRAGDLGDVAGLLEYGEAIEHAIDLEQVLLRVIELQTEDVEVDAEVNA